MLFSIEATVKVKESRTVTEEKAYWWPGSMKEVSYAKTENIDFASAKMEKRNLANQFSETPATKRNCEPESCGEAITIWRDRIFRQLSQTGGKFAILYEKWFVIAFPTYYSHLLPLF